jgi:nitrate reductase NapE component
LCFCLFVSVLCLVYPMLTVSLYCLFVCLSLSCVWCTQCQRVHQTQDRDKQTKTQYRDTVNIGYTRHRTKTNKQKVLCFCLFVFVLFLVYPMLTVSLCCVFVCLSVSCVWKTNKKHNTEILSTLGTPDTGQRQTNKNTTQRYCQHWVHQTQDKDKTKHNTEILSTLVSLYCVFVCLSVSCVWCTQC